MLLESKVKCFFKKIKAYLKTKIKGSVARKLEVARKNV